MNLLALAQAFRDGQVWGPLGRVKATAATLTRRSLLVYTAQTVLKVRVPALVPPFDQSLLSVRVALAERERWVGRRLSPLAYLDDCVIKRATDGSLILVSGNYAADEPVVATWRQPLERRADQVLLAGAGAAAFGAAIEAIAAFHEAAPEPEPSQRYARPTLIADRWRAAVAPLADAPAEVIRADEHARLVAETDEWLAAMDKTLVHRVMERRIREGHGELALEHVFLVDPPVVIDAADGALEDHLTDTGEDIARLAMELDLVAGPELSDAVMARYEERTLDSKLPLVAPLFKRLAAVRVAVETLADPDGDRQAARAFVELALGYRR